MSTPAVVGDSYIGKSFSGLWNQINTGSFGERVMEIVLGSVVIAAEDWILDKVAGKSKFGRIMDPGVKFVLFYGTMYAVSNGIV